MGQTESKTAKPEDYLKLFHALLRTSGVKLLKEILLSFINILRNIVIGCHHREPSNKLG